MQALSRRGMADRLDTALRALRALWRHMVQTRRDAVTRRHRVHPPTHTWRDPRPNSTPTMLVASDVLGGMRGVLP
jgi:hypothetical protein